MSTCYLLFISNCSMANVIIAYFHLNYHPKHKNKKQQSLSAMTTFDENWLELQVWTVEKNFALFFIFGRCKQNKQTKIVTKIKTKLRLRKMAMEVGQKNSHVKIFNVNLNNKKWKSLLWETNCRSVERGLFTLNIIVSW